MNVFKCVICSKKTTGWGNNPAPVKHNGLCCDKCNETVIIPARFGLLGIDKNYIIELLKERER